jgi:hypothetical protein
VFLRLILLSLLVHHTRGKRAICTGKSVRGYLTLAQSIVVEPYLDLQLQ